MTKHFESKTLKITAAGLAFAAAGAALAQGDNGASETPMPPTPREFRGVWVATVDNIDWPSRRDLPVEKQKAEMVAILNRAVKLKLNAVVFQVRPSCDALYDSKLEPWSEYLTGKQGQPPSPYWDPLATWIEEAHRRGLELHAWFNPYRAVHASSRGGIAPTHVSKARPNLVRKYGRQMWLDPGDKAVQDYSLDVMLDVVKRYDVDGIHIDDYFYPYKEKDSAGKTIPFPDDSSWQRYKASGGTLGRDDWRRESVDTFVRRLYEGIKAEKKWVRFGISPFGIWRPGYPASVKGLDQFAELYADARKWLRNGWVDYYTPQLYWKITAPNQSYPHLLRWWVEQNVKGRNLWPGNFTSRVLDGSWGPDEISEQIRVTREQPGATGNVHFSMKAFQQNQALNDAVAQSYQQPALPPASPWLDDVAPAEPRLQAGKDATGAGYLNWGPPGAKEPWVWVVKLRTGPNWATEIVPGWQRSRTRIGGRAVTFGNMASVAAVDRLGNESQAAIIRLQ